MTRALKVLPCTLAIAAGLVGVAALVTTVTDPAHATPNMAPTITEVGCTDGRGGVTSISPTDAQRGGDSNCYSWDPWRREQCAKRICDSWSAGSAPVWWR